MNKWNGIGRLVKEPDIRYSQGEKSTCIAGFTLAEIVQKVTEWKRKQDNKTQITEDMIADVLDEKYGIGNWGREQNGF